MRDRDFAVSVRGDAFCSGIDYVQRFFDLSHWEPAKCEVVIRKEGDCVSFSVFPLSFDADRLSQDSEQPR